MTGCTLPSLHRTPGSTWPPSRLKRHSNTSVSVAWIKGCDLIRDRISVASPVVAHGDACRNLCSLSCLRFWQWKCCKDIDEQINSWNFICRLVLLWEYWALKGKYLGRNPIWLWVIQGGLHQGQQAVLPLIQGASSGSEPWKQPHWFNHSGMTFKLKDLSLCLYLILLMVPRKIIF